MSLVIAWTMMFRVDSEAAAQKELGRAEALLGQRLRNVGVARYTKDRVLWSAAGETETPAQSVSEWIVDSLALANRLAHGWYLLGPDLASDGALEHLEGIFDERSGHARLETLAWAQFEVRRL